MKYNNFTLFHHIIIIVISYLIYIQCIYAEISYINGRELVMGRFSHLIGDNEIHTTIFSTKNIEPCLQENCTTKTGNFCNTTNGPVCGLGLVCIKNTCISPTDGIGIKCNVSSTATSVEGNDIIINHDTCSIYNYALLLRGKSPLKCYNNNNNNTCQSVGFPNDKCSSNSLCIGSAICINGTCIGVGEGKKCLSTPFDDCAPGFYCSTTTFHSSPSSSSFSSSSSSSFSNGTCVKYATKGQNCTSNTKCLPNLFCESKNQVCMKRFEDTINSTGCIADEQCAYGLLCYNKTCIQPIGVGKKCNKTEIGLACEHTVPETICSCPLSGGDPICIDPFTLYQAPTPNSCLSSDNNNGKGSHSHSPVAHSLNCAVENKCYIYQGEYDENQGLNLWIHGSCYKHHCSNFGYQKCLCDTADVSSSCHHLPICNSHSTKMPLWLLIVIIAGSICGGCCLISIACSLISCFCSILKCCFTIIFEVPKTGYHTLN